MVYVIAYEEWQMKSMTRCKLGIISFWIKIFNLTIAFYKLYISVQTYFMSYFTYLMSAQFNYIFCAPSIYEYCLWIYAWHIWTYMRTDRTFPEVIISRILKLFYRDCLSGLLRSIQMISHNHYITLMLSTLHLEWSVLRINN